jgi:hypothetical protein
VKVETLEHDLDVERAKRQAVTCEAKFLGMFKVPCTVRIPE